MAVTREFRTRFALGAVCVVAVLALLTRGSRADMCDTDPDSAQCNTGVDSGSSGSYSTVFESLTASRVPVVNGLSYDFYDKSCPNYQSIIQQAVTSALASNSLAAAGITRIMFHDCFIQGCDASLLLNGTGSEQESTPNLNLKQKAFELIDDIKAQLEAACPNTVSCADILSLATVEGIRQVNGPTISVPAGRRDGYTFAPNQTVVNGLPNPRVNVTENFPIFSNLGFSYIDFVALSGAHTLGKAQCASFSNRLRPTVDSELDSNLANQLVQLCPQDNTNATYQLDDSPSTFDNKYYKQLLCGEVLLSSDAAMEFDSNTGYLVKQYSRSYDQFSSQFATSFLKMSQLGVLTGNDGEIRKTCSCTN